MHSDAQPSSAGSGHQRTDSAVSTSSKKKGFFSKVSLFQDDFAYTPHLIIQYADYPIVMPSVEREDAPRKQVMP
jgi:hypothetical protein